MRSPFQTKRRPSGILPGMFFKTQKRRSLKTSSQNFRALFKCPLFNRGHFFLIHIKGKQADFSQEVESMRIEFDNVTEAKEGDKVGIKVSQPVHANDKVYKVGA